MVADPESMSAYRCFQDLSEEQRREVAQLAEDECLYPGQTLFREGDPSEAIFLLRSGNVEILYNIGEEGPAKVDTVSGEQILGCSALVEPYTYTSTARSLSEIETMIIDAAALRKLMVEDQSLGYTIQKQIIRMLLDRIIDLRLGC